MHLELIFKLVEGVNFHSQHFNVDCRRTSEKAFKFAPEVTWVCCRISIAICFCRCNSNLNFDSEFSAVRRRAWQQILSFPPRCCLLFRFKSHSNTALWQSSSHIRREFAAFAPLEGVNEIKIPPAFRLTSICQCKLTRGKAKGKTKRRFSCSKGSSCLIKRDKKDVMWGRKVVSKRRRTEDA